MSLYRHWPKMAAAVAAWIARPMHVGSPDGGQVQVCINLDSCCPEKAREILVCLLLPPWAEACRLPLAWENGEPDLVEAMVTTYLHQTAARLAVRAIKRQRATTPPRKRKGGRP